MKYALIIPDGMGDYPLERLGQKTPIEAANTPNLDQIALTGEIGECQTAPNNLSPGSDVCILSLLGYDPLKYYTGRAPLEAASLQIPTQPQDLIMRCNLIHINDQDQIEDHSAGNITSIEAHQLIRTLNQELSTHEISFYPGVSYRNIAVWKNKTDFTAKTVPPHDIPGHYWKEKLPQGPDSHQLTELIQKSKTILENHPINQTRKQQNKPQANLIWLWGTGYTPTLPTFYEQYQTQGAVISAVDLINGIAKLTKIKTIQVPGITAYFDTDYQAKGQYGIEALKQNDLVIIHIEAPDEAGHIGNLDEKINAIEKIDQHIIGPIYQHLKQTSHYRILICPDHYTPVEKRIHMNHPVPFALSGTGIPSDNIPYNEKNAASTGKKFNPGHQLMQYFLNKEKR